MAQWHDGSMAQFLWRLRSVTRRRWLGEGQLRAERLARQFFKFAQAGKLARVLEPEVHQEIARGPVEDRAPDHALAPRRDHQFLFHQRVDDAARIDPADLLDFGQRHRLAVGDHGQRFERLLREPDGRLQALHEVPQYLVVFSLGGELVAPRDLPNLNAVVRALEVRDHLLDLG